MHKLFPRLASFSLVAMLAACSSTRPLPKYEKPLARARVQQVRTTAYTHTEADHIQYGKKNALGMRLTHTGVRSAAADWSRWPAGTVFRVRETGEVYQVDDYGWALAGTNTIDLYQPTRAAMNRWGVRHVTIENIVWGDVDKSLAILRGRSKYAHVRRMIEGIEDRYEDLKRPLLEPVVAQAAPTAPLAPFHAVGR
jgi:3D (Asp-Asp-Asp) domain-containing protein